MSKIRPDITLDQEQKDFDKIIDSFIEITIQHKGLTKEQVEPFLKKLISDKEMQRAITLLLIATRAHYEARSQIADNQTKRK